MKTMHSEALHANLPSMLMTPIEECVAVSPGSLGPDLVDRLNRKSFDFAPVSGISGVVSVLRLQDLLISKQPLVPNDQEIRKNLLDESTDLEQLLDTIVVDNPTLVTHNREVIGLLTLADLNKPALRFVLYSRFATFEMELADFILHFYENDDSWIDKLKDDRQVQILGHYEQSKRKNVVVAHMVACTLTDLLNIVAKTKKMRDIFDLDDEKVAMSKFGSLIHWRNSVMHPVRPLITKPKDVKSIADTLRKMEQLGRALRKKTSTHKA